MLPNLRPRFSVIANHCAGDDDEQKTKDTHPLCRRGSRLLSKVGDQRLYFVHSFRATPSAENEEWILATTKYGRDFISVVEKGNISATQFHPEKSGAAGLAVLKGFLERETLQPHSPSSTNGECPGLQLHCLA